MAVGRAAVDDPGLKFVRFANSQALYGGNPRRYPGDTSVTRKD